VTNAPQGDTPGDEPGDRLRWSTETTRRVEELYRAYSRSLYSYLRIMHMDDFSNPEIADNLGLSQGAVRYHLSMGLRRLRQLLDLGGYGNE